SALDGVRVHAQTTAPPDVVVPSKASAADVGPDPKAAIDSATPAAQKLQNIDVTGSHESDDRRESTATKIVVTHDDIVRYGDGTLADVLKRLPGITVGAARAQGGGNEIR